MMESIARRRRKTHKMPLNLSLILQNNNCRAGSEATNRGIVGQISKSMTSTYIYIFMYAVTLQECNYHTIK